MEDKIVSRMAWSTLAFGGSYATLQAILGTKKSRDWDEIIQNFTSGIVVGGIFVIIYTMSQVEKKKTTYTFLGSGVMSSPSMENN